MEPTVARNRVVYLTYTIWDQAGNLFENERGERMTFRVTRIADGRLTVDANHPLAGQTVRFRVTVVAVRPATLDEIANGMPADGGGSPLMH